uniref:Cytochrome P450 n=1 Tax=Phanerodontia chrysosporium TaxID=2822231 RepID=G5EJU7_PHACH|nr:cytochrome P450 [Phanerodontia chrysosporium]
MTHPIPTPPTVPLLGHATLIDHDFPMGTNALWAREYGEIFRMCFPGRTVYVVSSYELVHEASNDELFRKSVGGPLAELRSSVGDGLVTANVPGEENWGIAHRVLMPCFSTISLRNMFDDMVDVVSQLVLKWERFGPHYRIDPAEDFTALTFEAISLCSMSYRMNPFYNSAMHPFAAAVVDFQVECMARSRRGKLLNALIRSAKTKFEQDRDLLMQYADEILEDRKAHPIEKKDVLWTMINRADPVTGKKMTDLSVKQNLLTLLMAGHETTSGMLTFGMYHLLKNPEAMRKLREEVDTIIGDRAMTADDLSRLPYLVAVMREALRLSPSAPARIVQAMEATTLGGGKHAIAKDDTLLIATYVSQRDPAIWGPDAEEFRPERMLDGKFEALPPDAWQPFGAGIRSCIGRPFAWQEVQIVLVSLMQRFTFAFADGHYDLRMKQTLTMKPHDFYIHAIPRTDRARVAPVLGVRAAPAQSTDGEKGTVEAGEGAPPMYVYFGSNMGTAESFAQRIAGDAGRHGFKATVAPLDAAVEKLASDGPVVVITASYEGKPPDNAGHFVEWLSNLGDESALAGVSFAVFGCGNRDWARTFQRIPTLVDDALGAHGGARIVPRGVGDASTGSFFEPFANWEEGLWAALAEKYETAKPTSAGGLELVVTDAGPGRADALRQPDTTMGTVVENRVLTAPGAPVKRHIEIQLPEGTSYTAGDYLAVLPTNPPRDVRRVLKRFGLPADQEITIQSADPTSLPTGRPVNVYALLSGYVELAQPATTRDLRLLIEASSTDAEKQVFKELADNHAERVLQPRLSVLDIIEAHPSVHVPFAAFLQLLPAMRVRQYSISSSPLADPARATLTIRVYELPGAPARRPHLGVGSTFHARLAPGDRVRVAVRPCKPAFRLPADPTAPLVLCCAGAGLAPMRGFLQERAMQKQAGRDVGKSLLFFGCRDPQEDYLYKDDDLKAWVDLDIVDVRVAFSRAPDQSLGCKYVQDRIWHDRADVLAAWDQGAKLYLCGSAKMATGVKDKLVHVVRDATGVDEASASEKFNEMMADRFATDIFE